MIAPTKIYDAFPTITPDEAADLICEAIRSKPKTINTRLGTFGEVAYALAPKAVDQILHMAYKVFPDSAAAKGEKDPSREGVDGADRDGQPHEGRALVEPQRRPSLGGAEGQREVVGAREAQAELRARAGDGIGARPEHVGEDLVPRSHATAHQSRGSPRTSAATWAATKVSQMGAQRRKSSRASSEGASWPMTRSVASGASSAPVPSTRSKAIMLRLAERTISSRGHGRVARSVKRTGSASPPSADPVAAVLLASHDVAARIEGEVEVLVEPVDPEARGHRGVDDLAERVRVIDGL